MPTRNWIVGVFVCGLMPSTMNAQRLDPWVFRAEIGRYEIHEAPPSGGDAPHGLAAGAHISRRWLKHLLLGLGIAHGFGTDNYTAFESGVEVQFVPNKPISIFLGVGAGLMEEENFSTLSGPYYASFGLEVRVAVANRIRGMIQRGSHINFGDPGTFRGPHLLSVGWVREF